MSDISSSFILAHIENFNLTKYLKIQDKMISEIGKENIFNYKKGVVYNSLRILFKHPIKIDSFINNKIIVNKYYKPLGDSFDNSTYIYKRIINLPLNENLSNKNIKKITKFVRRAINAQ